VLNSLEPYRQRTLLDRAGEKLSPDKAIKGLVQERKSTLLSICTAQSQFSPTRIPENETPNRELYIRMPAQLD